MLKFCIGTGVLAVPHAFSTGGVVPCALALLALLAWNDWAGRRLIQARDLLDADALRRFNTGGGESPRWRHSHAKSVARRSRAWSRRCFSCSCLA